MSGSDLTLAEARRIALSAQGLDRPRPAVVRTAHVRDTIHRLGLLQIDYVNVLIPAHYQVLYSRLGPYEITLLDKLVFRRREFTEQWAHEASIVPMESWPLLRHRRESHRVRPFGFEAALEQLADYTGKVLERVRTEGPLTADDLPTPAGTRRRIENAWQSVPRAVLEAFFGQGVLAISDRRPNFARAYDLSERVIPGEHHGRNIAEDEARRELLRQAARALGVATASDLIDYFRMSRSEARPRLTELVESGELLDVRVEGWREPAYLYPQAPPPKEINACALLSPFDPVIWFRPRAARLFDFDYRFEIFVPQEKRRWGVYVLPFLLGDRLVARVDLKADRAGRRLLVLAAMRESHSDEVMVSQALTAELIVLAGWLGLTSIVVGRRGDLARRLRKDLRTAGALA
jgi:uncharacterized protein YcaQ